MYEIMTVADKGRVIALWSPLHRQGGVSATTALLASYIAETEQDEDNSNKILLMSNELYGAPTAIHYISDEQLPTTLTEILELSRAKTLQSYEDIYTNSATTIKNLDVLQSVKRSVNASKYLTDEIENILEVARTGYKYIIVDTVAGTFDSTTSKILKNADVVIVCMPQDKLVWDNWIREMPGTYPKEIEGKQRVLVSSLHYEYTYMHYRKMAKELKNEELAWLSLNEIVKSSAENRRMLKMVAKELKNKIRDDCIGEISIIYEQVLKQIEIVKQQEVNAELKLMEDANKETSERLDSLIGLFDNQMGNEEEEIDTSLFGTDTSIDNSDNLDLLLEDDITDITDIPPNNTTSNSIENTSNEPGVNNSIQEGSQNYQQSFNNLDSLNILDKGVNIEQQTIAEDIPKQETEQAPEQSPKQAPEQATEQAPEQATEQAPEQSPKQAPEQATEQAPEQSPKQAPEQATEQAPDFLLDNDDINLIELNTNSVDDLEIKEPKLQTAKKINTEDAIGGLFGTRYEETDNTNSSTEQEITDFSDLF